MYLESVTNFPATQGSEQADATTVWVVVAVAQQYLNIIHKRLPSTELNIHKLHLLIVPKIIKLIKKILNIKK